MLSTLTLLELPSTNRGCRVCITHPDTSSEYSPDVPALHLDLQTEAIPLSILLSPTPFPKTENSPLTFMLPASHYLCLEDRKGLASSSTCKGTARSINLSPFVPSLL